MPIVAGRIGFLILQSTGFCNLDFSYCSLSNPANLRQTTDLGTAPQVTRLMFTPNVLCSLDIVWQAGKPLILNPIYYRKSIKIIEEAKPPDVSVHYGVQTDGTLINYASIDHKFTMDVSLDRPCDLHDDHLKYHNGSGSCGPVVAGIANLQARRHPFHCISVAAAQTLPRAANFFAHYSCAHPRAVGLNTLSGSSP